MSKIGRKPIAIGSVKIEIKDHEIHYKGKKAAGVHLLPALLKAEVKDNALTLKPRDAHHGGAKRDLNELWGLHRALLFNKIYGADTEFEKKINIIGLGYKAVLSGKKVTFSLGYSHKIDFELPVDVSLDIDKTGQNLTFRSSDREKVGLICSQVRAFRVPEPYKGTGIKLESEVIARKAGKTKA